MDTFMFVVSTQSNFKPSSVLINSVLPSSKSVENVYITEFQVQMQNLFMLFALVKRKTIWNCVVTFSWRCCSKKNEMMKNKIRRQHKRFNISLNFNIHLCAFAYLHCIQIIGMNTFINAGALTLKTLFPYNGKKHILVHLKRSDIL